MKLTIYCAGFLVGLLAMSANRAEATPLPDCVESVCSDIIYNKELGKATVVVWGKKGIINSYTFDLDSSAVRGPIIDSSNQVFSTFSDSNPPAPCAQGNCASSTHTTYRTENSIITVTVTYTFFNGALIDVSISRSVAPIPRDDTNMEP